MGFMGGFGAKVQHLPLTSLVVLTTKFNVPLGDESFQAISCKQNKKAVLSPGNRAIPLQIPIDIKPAGAGSCLFGLPESSDRFL